MASKFYRDFKHTAKEDVRVFLVPYRGAYHGFLKELASPSPKSIPQVFEKILRIAISPVVGAFSAIKAELIKPGESKNNICCLLSQSYSRYWKCHNGFLTSPYLVWQAATMHFQAIHAIHSHVSNCLAREQAPTTTLLAASIISFTQLIGN